MISSRKRQLVIALVLACICVPVLGAEPNEAKTELKSEISREPQQWVTGIKKLGLRQEKDGDRVRITKNVIGKGPIKPTHVAVLFIGFEQKFPSFYQYEVVKSILSNPAGQSLSQQQADFLFTKDCICQIGEFGQMLSNHHQFRVYAVSQDDAKKTAKALLEFLTKKAEEQVRYWEKRSESFEDDIAATKKQISEGDAELRDAKNRLEEIKNKVHYLSTDEAKKTVSELNKMLNDVNIEIAGKRAELQEIGDSLQKPNLTSWPNILQNLQEMQIQRIIELKGAEGKKETATKIRQQAEEFVNLHNLNSNLPKDLTFLRKKLSAYKRSLSSAEKELDKPGPDMLPPKVYQNKVTIYPVRLD